MAPRLQPLLQPGLGLSVESNPSQAQIWLDGEEVGYTPLTLAVEPGQHVVEVTKEHYATWRRIIEVAPGDRVELVATLPFLPFTTQLTEEGGESPVWGDQEDILYVVGSPETAHQLLVFDVRYPRDPELLEVRMVVPGSLQFSPSVSRLLLYRYADEQTRIPTLFAFDVASDVLRPIGPSLETGFVVIGAAWSPAGDIAYVTVPILPHDLPPEDRQRATRSSLWVSDEDGSNPREVFEFAPESVEVRRIGWSPAEEVLLIEEPQALWTLDLSSFQSTKLVEGVGIERAQWAPNGANVAYLEIDSETSDVTLWITNSQGSVKRRLLQGAITDFRWAPKDPKLIFARTDPSSQISSFWSVDPKTGEVLLLADGSIIGQRVDNFTISPSGKRIAFEGGDGKIWLLTLKE